MEGWVSELLSALDIRSGFKLPSLRTKVNVRILTKWPITRLQIDRTVRRRICRGDIKPTSRTERRKLERLNRIDQAQKRRVPDSGGLLNVCDAHFHAQPFSLILVIWKNCRQVDARGGTLNNVTGDQNNIQVIVNNFPSASIEEVDEIYVPVSVSGSLSPCGSLLNLHPRKIQTLIPSLISTRPWLNTVSMSLRGRPPLSRLISLQLRLSSRRYWKPLNLIFSLWQSRSAYSLIPIFYSILHVAYHAHPSSEQAIDTTFSRNPNSSLAIAHWYLHAQFASLPFHRGARRRDPPFIYPYYLSLSFVQV